MDILIKPIITEKMTSQAERLNRYGFIVAKEANKLEIKAAIQQMYGVKVDSVNTQQYVGKVKTRNTTRKTRQFHRRSYQPPKAASVIRSWR